MKTLSEAKTLRKTIAKTNIHSAYAKYILYLDNKIGYYKPVK
jgi:hypothetical protein